MWVKDHGDYLYNFAWSRVQSKEVAEDLVQETFISALKSLKSFRGDSTELTWLTAILKRKVIDHYRKLSSKKEIPASHFVSPFQKDGLFEGHWIMERAPKDWREPDENPLQQEEFQTIMAYCLSQLPPKWHSVFILKVMEEINSDEVCKELGCTPSNLWVMLHRARLQLRECIESKWLK
ncbi:MAG: sigma-70 family RNA polymerase sigma factor [Bacteroidales bacterium]|nr:sigma-70 family RNA polymerase sigma factor [Bacteroidales bacterium]